MDFAGTGFVLVDEEEEVREAGEGSKATRRKKLGERKGDLGETYELVEVSHRHPSHLHPQPSFPTPTTPRIIRVNHRIEVERARRKRERGEAYL